MLARGREFVLRLPPVYLLLLLVNLITNLNLNLDLQMLAVRIRLIRTEPVPLFPFDQQTHACYINHVILPLGFLFLPRRPRNSRIVSSPVLKPFITQLHTQSINQLFT